MEQNLTLRAEVTGAGPAAASVRDLGGAVSELRGIARETAAALKELTEARDRMVAATLAAAQPVAGQNIEEYLGKLRSAQDAAATLEGRLGAADFFGDADALRDQTDALTGVTDAYAEYVATLRTGTPVQEDANVSLWNLTRILNQVHPQLGYMVTMVARLSTAMSQLGQDSLSLTGIAGKLTEVVKENAGAIKLLGAGGLAWLSVGHAINKWKELKQEIEETSRAVHAFSETQTTAQGQAIQRQDSVNKAIDATGKAVDAQTRKAAARASERLTAAGAEPGLAVELTAGLAAGGLLTEAGGVGVGADVESRDRLLVLTQILAAGGSDADRLRKRMLRGDRGGLERLLAGRAGQTAIANVEAKRALEAELAGSALSSLQAGGFEDNSKWSRLRGFIPQAASATGPTAALEREIGLVAPERDAGSTATQLIQLRALLQTPEVAEYFDRSGKPLSEREGIRKRLEAGLKELGMSGKVTPDEVVKLRGILNRIESKLQGAQASAPITINVTRTSYDRNITAPGGRPRNGIVVGAGRKDSVGD